MGNSSEKFNCAGKGRWMEQWLQGVAAGGFILSNRRNLGTLVGMNLVRAGAGQWGARG